MIKQYLEKRKNKFNRYMLSKIPNKKPEAVYKIIKEFVSRGGKRFRPALVELAYLLIKPNTKKIPKAVYDIGSSIELFHNFTLIHDDIEDNSLQRRGKPTIHRIYGTPIAINAGDGLFCLVFNIITKSKNLTNEQKIKIFDLFSKYFMKVLEGQAIELSFYKDNKIQIPEKQYFDMVYGKTASLIELSLLSGAYLAGATKSQMKHLSIFAKNIGIAFQIQDDVLNIIGDFKKYKKEIGGDISEGKRTLLTIHAFQNLNKTDKDVLEKILVSNTKSKSKINKAISLLKKSNSINYAIKIANQKVKISKKYISKFKDSKYKSLLIDLANLFITRES